MMDQDGFAIAKNPVPHVADAQAKVNISKSDSEIFVKPSCCLEHGRLDHKTGSSDGAESAGHQGRLRPGVRRVWSVSILEPFKLHEMLSDADPQDHARVLNVMS